MAAGVAIGSARAAGSVRGVPVGWASMARRAAAMSRGRPDVHIPRSRSDASSVNALHASASAVSRPRRLAPDHPALTRRPEDEQPPCSDVAEHVRDRIGSWQAGQRRPPPLAPDTAVHPARDRRCERLRGIERLGPVPPGKVTCRTGQTSARPRRRRRTPPGRSNGPTGRPGLLRQEPAALPNPPTTRWPAGPPARRARCPPGCLRQPTSPPAPSMARTGCPTCTVTPTPASHRSTRSDTSRGTRPASTVPAASTRSTRAPRAAAVAAASHPTQPPPTTTSRTPGPTPAQKAPASERVCSTCTPGLSQPDGRMGLAPVATTTERAATCAAVRARDHQPAAPAGRHHEALGTHPQPDLVRMGPHVHPHRRAQVDLGLRVLGQRWPVVRGIRLRTDQDDPPGDAGGAEQRTGARPRQPRAHDHHIRHEPAA